MGKPVILVIRADPNLVSDDLSQRVATCLLHDVCYFWPDSELFADILVELPDGGKFSYSPGVPLCREGDVHVVGVSLEVKGPIEPAEIARYLMGEWQQWNTG